MIYKKRGFSVVKDSCIKAVHDDDLVGLLKSLGVYEDIKEEKTKCFFCDSMITLENLGTIFPQRDNILFSCDSSICINKLIEQGDIENGDK